MARRRPLRWSLALNLTGGVIAAGLAILAIALLAKPIMIERTSRIVIDHAQIDVEQDLRERRRLWTSLIRLVANWTEKGWNGSWTEETFDRFYLPLLRSFPHLAAVHVADSAGNHYVIERQEAAWTSTLIIPADWGTDARRRRWTDAEPTPETDWRPTETSASEAAWFSTALSRLREPTDSETDSGVPPRHRIFVDDPPSASAEGPTGPVASVALSRPDGTPVVVALEADFAAVLAVWQELPIPGRGTMALLSGSGKTKESLVLTGPPHLSSRSPSGEEGSDFIRPAAASGGPIDDLIAHVFDTDGFASPAPTRFRSGGETWWGGVRAARSAPIKLAEEAPATWIAVAFPEADLLEGMPNLTGWIVAVTALAALASFWWARRLAAAYTRPIDQLTGQSRRMRDFDFGHPVQVDSRVREFGALGQALDGLRRTLWSFMAEREEVSVAEQVVRTSLPSSIPSPADYEIAASRRPASETSGGLFDLLFCDVRRPQGDKDPGAGTEDVAFLVLDPDGSGMEPAVLGLQVRAIFRAGVHSGAGLAPLARQIDAYLRTDLGDGETVRTWIGQLDTRNHRVVGVSAGIETMLAFAAEDQTLDRLVGRGDPLGTAESDDERVPWAVDLLPGDVVLIASNGVVDATNPEGAAFGVTRLESIVKAHHGDSAAALIATITTEVDDFSAAQRSLTDQTLLIIKRKAAVQP